MRRPLVVAAAALTAIPRPLRIAALACAVVGLTLGTAPAQAKDGPLIQPGAPVRMSSGGGAVGQPCTLNFVFRDRRHTYIGAGVRCAADVGERASIGGREFGTLVFRAVPTYDPLPSLNAPFIHPGSMDEFALVRVDASQQHRVSPVVLDLGRAPSGVAVADRARPGDLMSMTGQGAGYREGPTRHRRGALTFGDKQGFHLAIPGSLGDGGSPVLDANLKAYGVLASAVHVKGPYGTTVERILHLLHKAGFDVKLATA